MARSAAILIAKCYDSGDERPVTNLSHNATARPGIILLSGRRIWAAFLIAISAPLLPAALFLTSSASPNNLPLSGAGRGAIGAPVTARLLDRPGGRPERRQPSCCSRPLGEEPGLHLAA